MSAGWPMAAASVALSMALGVGAECSSKAPVHPPALGDCIPTQDASCGDPGSSGGGGGVGPIADAGERTDVVAQVSDAGACGRAATLLGAMNPTCLPCIEDPGNCCTVDLACSIQSGCLDILTCVLQMCVPGDQACLGNCESQWLTAVTTYEDFAACIGQHCPAPQCPVPTTTTPPDH